jgi:putative transposase
MGTARDDIECRESTERDNGEGRQLSPEQAAAAAMVADAKTRGLEQTGPNGLPKLFTKRTCWKAR